MSIQVTIIGLGQVGTSIGLALSDKTDQFNRIGNDSTNETARQAQKMGAIDQVIVNLPKSVENADIVVLAVPVDEIKSTLDVILPDLKPEVVVLDTSPIQVAVLDWAKELFPRDRFFVKFTPSLNPTYLKESGQDVDAPHADLFKNSVVAISSLSNTHPDALKLASDFAAILGAKPYYVDPYECDGLIAAGQQLPKLVAAALLNATTQQPGWLEGGKMAGKDFHQVSDLINYLFETKEFGQAALANRDNMIRVIDNMIDSLKDMRDALIANDGKTIQGLFETAQKGYEEWYKSRKSGNWEKSRQAADMPKASDAFGSLFSFKRLGKKDD